MSLEGFKPIKNENEDIANNDIKGDDILVLERKKEIIKSLNDLLEEKSPDTFNSKWIEKNNRSLSRKINYDFNLGSGKVDWTKILSLLDNKWKEKWEVKNRRNVQLPEIANEIVNAFKKENPDKISPEWINDKFNNNYQLLKKILPQKGHKEIDYQLLLDLLPSDIKERWEVKRRNVQLPEIANEIVDAFRKENPDKISPSWIENKMRNNYDALNKILHRKSNGGIDYQPLLDLLPSDIKEKWEIKRRNVQLPEIANEIVDAFRKENSDKISPTWLYSKINSNYQILNNILPKKGHKEIDYQPLLDLLPFDIRGYWKPFLKRNVQLPEIANEIVDAFRKENPDKISPSWIENKMRNNYDALKKILHRKSNGGIDYQPLLDLLPSDIRKYWKQSLRVDDFIPKELYIDNKETDLIIDQHKDKMYTFYIFLDKEKDREAREYIIRDMRKIILKGNVDALDRLSEHLMFTVENWIEDDPILKPWRYAKDKLMDIIKKCIYMYDENKGTFYRYLAITIKKRTPDIITSGGNGNILVKKINGNLDYYEEE